jgi:hypothetical protein
MLFSPRRLSELFIFHPNQASEFNLPGKYSSTEGAPGLYRKTTKKHEPPTVIPEA